MEPFPRGRLLPTVLILAAALLLDSGCGHKARTITGPDRQPFPYPKLSSPQNVLQAMAFAYVRRDTAEIKLVYDSLYVGSSTDQTGGSPTPIMFTKSDEVRHVAGLARAITITGVSCTLYPALIRFRDLGDPPGWATIDNPIGQIVIDDAPSSYATPTSGLTMQFKFAPTTPDSTSPTDTTWTIIRWSEVRN